MFVEGGVSEEVLFLFNIYFTYWYNIKLSNFPYYNDLKTRFNKNMSLASAVSNWSHSYNKNVLALQFFLSLYLNFLLSVWEELGLGYHILFKHFNCLLLPIAPEQPWLDLWVSIIFLLHYEIGKLFTKKQ